MNGDENECIICYDSYKTGIVTECGHRCCLKCGLRYKFISSKSGCPICLREIKDEEMMFQIVKTPNARFKKTEDSYVWANCIVCEPEEIEEIEEILTRSCKLCKTEFYDNETLIKHYAAKHKRHLCELCVEYRCEFPFEYIVYSIGELNSHRTEKTIGNGHPLCGFCRERFYTQEMLLKHCRKTHEICYICERLGKKNEYYKNYQDLESHFKKAHYTCDERMCQEAKCYAFIDEVELAAHKGSLHPVKKQHKIKLNPGGPSEKKRTERKLKAPTEEKKSEEPAPPKHLDREELLRTRDMKSKYTAMIKRNYNETEKIIAATDEYNELKIDLNEYVWQIREILYDTRTIEFVDRIGTYLLPDRTEDIKNNFPKIRRMIEFAPSKMAREKKEECRNPAAIEETSKTLEKTCTKNIPVSSGKKSPNIKLGWSSGLTKTAWSKKTGEGTDTPIHISNLEIKLPKIQRKEEEPKEEKQRKPKHRTFVLE